MFFQLPSKIKTGVKEICKMETSTDVKKATQILAEHLKCMEMSIQKMIQEFEKDSPIKISNVSLFRDTGSVDGNVNEVRIHLQGGE